MTMTLKDQAWESGLILSDQTPEWNENDWPPLVGGWRSHHASVVLDHTVVVLGGYKHLQHNVNSVLVLNLAKPDKQWRQGPSMNKKRSGHAAVVCNGGIYVMGGFNGYSKLDCMEQIDANDLLQPLSTSSITHESHWTKLKCRLSTGRNGCCAVTVKNRYIVVLGGWDGGHRLSSVDIIDTSNHTVIAGPNMNVPRKWCASAVVGHRIFVVGGSTVEYLDFARPSDNAERNDTLSTFISSLSGWTTHSDLVLSASRDSCAVVTVGSCLVVAGDDQTVEILDTHHSRMWNLPPFKNGRADCSMVTVADQVAVIGGWHNPSCATLRLMDNNTWCFRQLCDQPRIEWYHGLERSGNDDVNDTFSTISSSTFKRLRTFDYCDCDKGKDDS